MKNLKEIKKGLKLVDQIQSIRSANNKNWMDLLRLSLKKSDSYKDVIPSKIFEALAMKKPLLLGVDGEARKHFIDKAKSGLYYTPEDLSSLKQQVLYFLNEPEERKKMGENAREYVADNFDRNKIAQGLYDELQNM